MYSWSSILWLAPWLLFLFGTAAMDFFYRKVKNNFLIIFLLLFFIINIFDLNPFEESEINFVFSFLIVLVLFIPFYALGLMAAGDVKFAMVMSLFLGMNSGLFVSIILGGLLAGGHAAYLIFKRSNRLSLKEEINQENRNQKGKVIPYAGYMAIASLGWLCLYVFRGSL